MRFDQGFSILNTPLWDLDKSQGSNAKKAIHEKMQENKQIGFCHCPLLYTPL